MIRFFRNVYTILALMWLGFLMLRRSRRTKDIAAVEAWGKAKAEKWGITRY